MPLSLELADQYIRQFYMPSQQALEEGLRREDFIGFLYRRNPNPMPYFRFFEHPKRTLRAMGYSKADWKDQ